MFKITLQPTYKTKVEVELPGGSRYSFTAIFERLSQSELDAMIVRVSDGTMTDNDLIDRVLRGWEDIKDENGLEVPFNPDTLTTVLDIVPLRPTIVKAYFESLRSARAKN